MFYKKTPNKLYLSVFQNAKRLVKYSSVRATKTTTFPIVLILFSCIYIFSSHPKYYFSKSNVMAMAQKEKNNTNTIEK